MSAGAYVGVNNIARKVNKAYVGVNGVARRVKKAYVGVNGVARPCFSSGVEYYGTITPGLLTAKSWVQGSYINNTAIFAGGSINSSQSLSDAVTFYDSSFSRSYGTALTTAVANMASAQNNTYALFAGGLTTYTGSAATNKSYAYDSGLTRTSLTLSYSTGGAGGCAVGNYFIFAGGSASINEISPVGLTTANAFSNSLSRTTITSLTSPKYTMGTAAVGNYALFAGGATGTTVYTTVDSYDVNLTHSSSVASYLSGEKYLCVGCTTTNYAIFAGGEDASQTRLATVDAYNSNLTRISLSDLNLGRRIPAGIGLGEFAIIGGLGSYTDVYDNSLTHTLVSPLTNPRDCIAAAIINNYALFAGGQYGTTDYADIDAYVSNA